MCPLHRGNFYDLSELGYGQSPLISLVRLIDFLVELHHQFIGTPIT